MSPRPLISDSEKDKHKTRDQLLEELSDLRALLAAKTDDLAGCERVVGMLDGITGPVLVLDDASQIVYANSAAAGLFAKDRGAIEGRGLWDLYPKGHDTLFYNAYDKARKARSTGKFREHHRLLGKWFEVYLYPVSGGMTVLFNDITVSRQMEELPRLALTLLHNLKDNVFLLRADGRMFHVNNETKNSLGYSSDELHKMSILDVVPPASQREWHDILGRFRQHGSMTFESRLRARDGHEFPVEVYANYIELYGSNYYTVSARDITERMQAEHERAFMASIVHTTHEAILSLTSEGIITSWNHGAEKLYGYTADETIGHCSTMLAPPDRQTETAEALERMRSEGLPEHYETVRRRKDGTLIDVSLTLSPILDASGASVGSSVIVHDITERKRNERALKESEANLSQAQRMAHIGNWVWDTKADRIYCSDEFYRIFGMIRQEFITYGQFIDTVNPENRDSVNQAVDASLGTGEHYSTDYRVVWPDGNERIVHAEGEVILDGAGKPVRMFGTVQDVTERKKSEAVLEKYRLFSENAHDIVLFVRRDGRILEANAAAVKAYGYTYEELLSLSIYDLRASDIGYHVDEQMNEAYNKGILFEALHRRKDGSEFPVEVSSQGRIINGQKVLLSVVRDITERKRIEGALRENEEKFRLVADFTYDWETWLGPGGNIIYISPSCERITGYRSEEFMENPCLLAEILSPEDRAVYEEHLRTHLEAHSEPDMIDFRIVTKDGSVRWINHQCQSVFGSNGQWLGRRIGNRDITERKQAEAALQIAKAQAELYVDLMGHDINNMNHIAMASLELVLMYMDQNGKLDASDIPLIEKSMESLNNSSKLIRNVQKLQRASTEGVKIQAVDVAVVLRDIIAEERSTPGRDVTIYYKNEATHCLVTANELLRDVFANIISNAIKHSGPDRHLTIGVAVESIDDGGRKFCRVAIDDNGPGIPDEVKPMLFRRFSRGETKAKGSGLGLYLVKTMVEHYGGDILVEDRVPGDHTKGAKFVVTIPSAG